MSDKKSAGDQDEPEPGDDTEEEKARKAEEERQKKEGETIAQIQKILKSLLNLGEEDKASLEAPKDKPLVAPLAHAALDLAGVSAAALVRRGLSGTRSRGGRGEGKPVSASDQKPANTVLVTADPDLAGLGATHAEVNAAIDGLTEAARGLRDAIDWQPTKPVVESLAVGPLAQAALALLGTVAEGAPALAGLLSAKRTVSVEPLAANDLAAAAAILKALVPFENTTFVHESFRRTEGGAIGEKLKRLAEARAGLQAVLGRLEPKAPERGAAEAMIVAIDAFQTTLRTVPKDGKRTPLAAALLAQDVHGDPRAFTHVLLVKSEGGHTHQTVNDRPLWFRDKLAIFTEVAVTVILIEIKTNGILASGTITAVAEASGDLGDPIHDRVTVSCTGHQPRRAATKFEPRDEVGNMGGTRPVGRDFSP